MQQFCATTSVPSSPVSCPKISCVLYASTTLRYRYEFWPSLSSDQHQPHRRHQLVQFESKAQTRPPWEFGSNPLRIITNPLHPEALQHHHQYHHQRHHPDICTMIGVFWKISPLLTLSFRTVSFGPPLPPLHHSSESRIFPAFGSNRSIGKEQSNPFLRPFRNIASR